MSERYLERKFSVRAHGRTLVLHKHRLEKLEHRVMMALLWALYLPSYPALRVDIAVNSRYRPDLVELDGAGEPIFWGECGAVGTEKLRHLCRRYSATHLVFAKWSVRLDPIAAQIEGVLRGLKRSAPVELIAFPADSGRHIDEHGTITIQASDLERRVWQPGRGA